MENLDLRQIRAFDAILRHGGFSKASREIGLTQPTLSAHILNLERDLGVKLFDRSGRAVTLTPAGMVFSDYAMRILELCRESILAIEAFSGQIKGDVHVESSTVPGEYILPRWLKNFLSTYPEVQVTLTVNDSQKVLEKVSSGEVHLGITGTPGNHPSLQSELLCEEEILLVAAPDIIPDSDSRRVDITEISMIPMIRRESGSGTRKEVEKALRNHHVEPESLNWTTTLGSTRAVVEGALSGLGAAFLSRSAVAEEIASEQLLVIELKGVKIRRGFYIVSRRGRTLSPAAEKLRDALLRAGFALLS